MNISSKCLLTFHIFLVFFKGFYRHRTKVMLSVLSLSLSLSTHAGSRLQPHHHSTGTPPDMFKHVQLEPYHRRTLPPQSHPGHVQACLLCSMDCQQASGWHSTETPSWSERKYRSGTVNSKSFIGKVFLRIKWKFELTYAL